MRMKWHSIILGSLLTCHAMAYLHQFEEMNFYARGQMGTGQAQDTKKDFTGTSNSLKVTYHPTATGGATLGYRHEHWRLELEYAYFRNTHAKWELNRARVNENSYVRIHSALFNILYDFSDEYYATIPYFGAGVGHSNIKISGYKHLSNNILSGSENENEFAWQGILGVGYYLSKNSVVDINYRHFATSPARKTLDSEYHTNTFNLGYTYHFL